jgi:peptidase M42 family hydrolase
LRRLEIDVTYLSETLRDLLHIPSPTGHTGVAIDFVAAELARLGVPVWRTRRGALRAELSGARGEGARAIAAHVDTVGAMVTSLKPNGRLQVVPVGTWSSRFAEGARVTVLTDGAPRRGTILPLKASGHVFDDEVDSLPVRWSNVEVRVDELASSEDDLTALGFHVGDLVAVDSCPEISPAGFFNARHLDDKAGVAALLAAVRALREAEVALPASCHLLFTVSEEVGTGASSGLPGDLTELVAVDIAPVGEGQASTERAVTVALGDSSGPFDRRLSQHLLALCQEHGVRHRRDVFRHYRCDAAAAHVAGLDVPATLVAFGVDASHGYERTHVDALRALGELLCLYLQSPIVPPPTGSAP